MVKILKQTNHVKCDQTFGINVLIIVNIDQENGIIILDTVVQPDSAGVKTPYRSHAASFHSV